jgi:hypothetical protein
MVVLASLTSQLSILWSQWSPLSHQKASFVVWVTYAKLCNQYFLLLQHMVALLTFFQCRTHLFQPGTLDMLVCSRDKRIEQC